ncbi:hypothetical protein FVE85_7618 [Porphyridium purpureum]|uniref:Uncharacterized protein n=1 Tax=Porphyridium purpureum TaxID=35688 RepID=A0A5J4ZB94_PORPP|nr:hypothetical protein FVE85_7618 [Porphyridium purpureum]|eukprot:POR1321..scf295_1
MLRLDGRYQHMTCASEAMNGASRCARRAASLGVEGAGCPEQERWPGRPRGRRRRGEPRGGWSVSACLVGLCVLALAARVQADSPAVPGARSRLGAEDLDGLDDDALAKYAEKLDTSMGQIRETTERIRDSEFDARTQKSVLDEDCNRARGARDWEFGEKRKQEQTLLALERQMQDKKLEQMELVEKVTQLRAEVGLMRLSKEELENLTAVARRKLTHPWLLDALEESSGALGTAGQLIINTTVREIVPKVVQYEEFLHESSVRARPVVIAMCGVLVYASGVVCFYVLSSAYRRWRDMLGLHDILALGDSLYTGYWLSVFLLSVAVRRDPLYILYAHSRVLFLSGLIFNLLTYSALIVLRLFVLFQDVSLPHAAELLMSIIIGNHYYICVWRPMIVNHRFDKSMYMYFLFYAAICGLLASRRISSWQGHGELLRTLRGGQLKGYARH